ncbi:hypothetical protein L1887_18586 [Cichorium endivia]|nr:hypothetical protein L1887_18586 [Cichorium endivia]
MDIQLIYCNRNIRIRIEENRTGLNKEEKEAVDGGSKAPSTVEASRGEKEAVEVDGEKEAVAVGCEKEAVTVGGRSKAAAADERHRSVVMQGEERRDEELLLEAMA